MFLSTGHYLFDKGHAAADVAEARRARPFPWVSLKAIRLREWPWRDWRGRDRILWLTLGAVTRGGNTGATRPTEISRDSAIPDGREIA